jgi:hypothetical protein
MPISFFMMLLLHLRSHQLKLQHQADLRGLDVAKREAEFERSRRIEDTRKTKAAKATWREATSPNPNIKKKQKVEK